MKKCFICNLAAFLGGLGALNWGLVALLDFNLVSKTLGEGTQAERIVYIVVGVSGLLLLISLVKSCPCQKKTA